MYLDQAINELSVFSENPSVVSVIEKLKKFSMDPKLLTLPEINQLIQEISPFHYSFKC